MFYTKSGRLTKYALGCGYVEVEWKNGIQIKLWHEHGCFHVRKHDFINNNRVFWESFRRLKDARKLFDNQK
jgi:hypothetical protein